VLVVAWTLRGGQWLRWQSPPLTTRGQLDLAWQKADQWAQTPGDDERRFEVAITPLQDWQIFYFRSDAWTNPQSSDATGKPLQQPSPMPEGVRLVLVLPPGQALAGRITRDWVRPTVGGGKS
jgi:general secretion pathway protein J